VQRWRTDDFRMFKGMAIAAVQIIILTLLNMRITFLDITLLFVAMFQVVQFGTHPQLILSHKECRKNLFLKKNVRMFLVKELFPMRESLKAFYGMVCFIKSISD